jgi:uncharacterized membrane protein
MVAILAVAALSIDVITLYLAKEETKRSAAAAAVAAAKFISLRGVTGDPQYSRVTFWQASLLRSRHQRRTLLPSLAGL